MTSLFAFDFQNGARGGWFPLEQRIEHNMTILFFQGEGNRLMFAEKILSWSKEVASLRFS